VNGGAATRERIVGSRGYEDYRGRVNFAPGALDLQLVCTIFFARLDSFFVSFFCKE
jgi:hypothetical protein